MNFSFFTARDNNATAGKDHGKGFRSELASSFRVIVHYTSFNVF